MTSTIAFLIVLLSGLYLVGLAAISIVSPERAARFLNGFASSGTAHLLELSLRLVVGMGFIRYSSQMLFPGPFEVFGWVLAATALMLLVVPWRWHRNFAQWVVPFAIRNLRAWALGAFLLGVTILWAVLSGPGVEAWMSRFAA